MPQHNMNEYHQHWSKGGHCLYHMQYFTSADAFPNNEEHLTAIDRSWFKQYTKSPRMKRQNQWG